MSALDAPPGYSLCGRVSGEFVARHRSQRLTNFCFITVLASSGLALALAARRPFHQITEMMLFWPLLCFSIACVGFAVRRARLCIDERGLRWGWKIVGFCMGPRRIRRIIVYSDAVAMTPYRGSTWFLSARDWECFEELPAAIARVGWAFESTPKSAPLRARLQSYGRALDGLLIGVALLSACLALATAF